MSIRYQIDPAGRHVDVVLEGRVTPDEYLAHVRVLADECGLSCTRLVDARTADFRITPADVDRTIGMISRLREQQGHARTAFVVSGDALYGMMRMYQIRTEAADPGFGVFRSMEEGRAWLDGGA